MLHTLEKYVFEKYTFEKYVCSTTHETLSAAENNTIWMASRAAESLRIFCRWKLCQEQLGNISLDNCGNAQNCLQPTVKSWCVSIMERDLERTWKPALSKLTT